MLSHSSRLGGVGGVDQTPSSMVASKASLSSSIQVQYPISNMGGLGNTMMSTSSLSNAWEPTTTTTINARVLVIGERFSCGSVTAMLEKAGHTGTYHYLKPNI